MKGKKHNLLSDEDVEEIHRVHWQKKHHFVVLLRPHQLPRNMEVVRKGSVNESTPQSKRAVTQQKLQEIEGIVAQLKEKHGNTFTVEQLNAWAHLHIGKHSSYDSPNNPNFVSRKSAQTSSSTSVAKSDLATNLTKMDPCSHSPGQRVHLRRECIDQLSRWHTLKQSGGITSEEYEELRKNIIGDIRNSEFREL